MPSDNYDKKTHVFCRFDEKIITLGIDTLVVPYLSELPLEMGMYDIINKKRYHSSFAWEHVVINSITIENRMDTCWYLFDSRIMAPAKYKIEVSILQPGKCMGEIITHTFYCINGLYFFVNSILRLINSLLNKGYSISDINFDFLEEQCEKINTKTGNGIIAEFKLPYESTPKGFYKLISKADLDAYEYSCGGRNGGFYGIYIELTIKSTDKYVNSIISKYLHTNPTIDYEKETTRYSYNIEERCHDNPYQEYKRPVNTQKKNQIKSELLERIIVDCIKSINQESAIIYHALNHQ